MAIAINLFPLAYMLFTQFGSIDMVKLFVATRNSLILAVVSVVLSFLFALPSAYVFVSQKSYYRYLVIIFVFFISIMPPFLISILFTNLFYFLGIKNGFLVLSFTHMLLIFPYSLALMILGFSYVPQSATYSSKLYASNFFTGFMMFYFPFMKNIFLVVAILGITISMSQYIVTLMLGTASFTTLMVQIIPYLKSADLQSANSYGIVFIVNSIFAIYILYRVNNVISKNK